jgi:acetyl esterase
MSVHPTFEEMVKITKEAKNPPVQRQSLAELRRGPHLIKPLAGEPPPVPRILNHMIESGERQLILRMYYPKDKEKLPILLYFHPGCFVKGDIEAHDIVCRQITLASGCIVASVNYSLAPEHKFPAALEDGYAALDFLAKHAQDVQADGRLAIGGENAGANIAAALTHRLRDERGFELDFQVLIYPQLDLTLSHPSINKYGKGYLLEKEALEWYRSRYLPLQIHPSDPRVSPLFQPKFEGLPPALIITAAFDPLKDEGELYAEKLKRAGVPTTLTCYPGMLHGFFQMGGVIDEGQEAIRQVGDALKQVFF